MASDTSGFPLLHLPFLASLFCGSVDRLAVTGQGSGSRGRGILIFVPLHSLVFMEYRKAQPPASWMRVQIHFTLHSQPSDCPYGGLLLPV